MNTIISEKYQTYNNYIKNKSEEFSQKSFKSSNKTEDYVKRLNFLNKKTGEIFPVTYNFKNKQKSNYVWYNFVSTYIQDESIKNKKVSVFVTYTLPTAFHPFTAYDKKGNKLKIPRINTRFKDDYSGAKLLNDSFRHLYNNFMIDRKKVSMQYLKVIEPHKDFTPHLHALFFINPEQVEAFKNHFNNTRKLFKLGVQFDFTLIDDTKASVAYLLKYVKKSLYSDNEADLRVIDGWKKSHKIRMFTHSQINVSRSIFRVLSSNIDLKSYTDEKKSDGSFIESKSYSILENVSKLCYLDIDYSFKDNSSIFVYKNKKSFNSSNRYHAKINILKNKKIDIEDYYDIIDRYNHWTSFGELFNDLDKINFDYMAMHNYLYEYELIDIDLEFVSNKFDFKSFFQLYGQNSFNEFKEWLLNYVYDCINSYKTSYKIIEFTIFDTKINEFIYDKKDFELI